MRISHPTATRLKRSNSALAQRAMDVCLQRWECDDADVSDVLVFASAAFIIEVFVVLVYKHSAVQM